MHCLVDQTGSFSRRISASVRKIGWLDPIHPVLGLRRSQLVVIFLLGRLLKEVLAQQLLKTFTKSYKLNQEFFPYMPLEEC